MIWKQRYGKSRVTCPGVHSSGQCNCLVDFSCPQGMGVCGLSTSHMDRYGKYRLTSSPTQEDADKGSFGTGPK